MHIVIDTLDERGRRRAMVVKALACDERALTAHKDGRTLRLAVSKIVDWALIDDVPSDELELDRWISRRPEGPIFGFLERNAC